MKEIHRELTREDNELIQLMMNNGETREKAISKIYSGVYSLKQSDFSTVASLCESNGEEYKEEAFQRIFKLNREKCKRLILAKKARIENPKILKKEDKPFSWSVSVQKRR